MTDPHLNVFCSYERRQKFHEDNLARALVCTLRSSPRLTRAFVQKFV